MPDFCSCSLHTEKCSSVFLPFERKRKKKAAKSSTEWERQTVWIKKEHRKRDKFRKEPTDIADEQKAHRIDISHVVCLVHGNLNWHQNYKRNSLIA